MVRTHTVVAGDTLSALALRYGSTVAALARANNIPNPDRIFVGQRLVIPSGALSTTGGPETVVSAPPRPELEITITGGNVSTPPSAPGSGRACPTWWPDAACHVWSRVPLVLAVVAAGAVLIAVSRRSGTPPPRPKKRRR
jgi:hypothetical protein